MRPDTEITQFVDRYVAAWNEPDPDRRRSSVARLWADDGVQITESAEYRGHQELETRITEAYQEFVSTGGFRFVSGSDAVGHHDAIMFRTHMIPAGGGDAVWTGAAFVTLDQDGRIRRDYQFTLPANPPASTERPTAAAAATRPVVEMFLSRLGEGDPDRIAEMFAEPIDWRLDWPAEGHPAVPWIRSRTTRADVAEHFRALDAYHLPEKRGALAPTVLIDGADAVVLGEIKQVVRATGRPYTARLALRLTVEDGLVTRYHVYEDSLAVAEALADQRIH